jgi:Cupin superfamily protein
MTVNFDALLAPLGITTFFAEYYEKKHLHVTGSSDLRAKLLTTDEFWQALVQVSPESGDIVCFPEQLGVTRDRLFSDENTLRAYFDAGHPVVWNRARGISPRIDEVCRLLANTFGGHVWPNVYATGTAGTPFDLHFDAHEVIAIHCAGQKQWEISRIRVDRPIDAVEMAPAIAHALRTRRDEAAANTLDTFTVSPADLVYIPRGQFHQARTQSGRSLHVTFGIELPTGYDLAKRILQVVLGDSAMREYPLPKSIDVNGEQMREWCSSLASRLNQGFSAEQLVSVHDELQRAWIRKSGGETR